MSTVVLVLVLSIICVATIKFIYLLLSSIPKPMDKYKNYELPNRHNLNCLVVAASEHKDGLKLLKPYIDMTMKIVDETDPLNEYAKYMQWSCAAEFLMGAYLILKLKG